MHSSTFGKGWVGMSACPLVVLACESLHVCTVCIWRCEHARFCVEVFYALYINFHSFIHSRHSNSGNNSIRNNSDSNNNRRQSHSGNNSIRNNSDSNNNKITVTAAIIVSETIVTVTTIKSQQQRQ